MDKVSKVFFVTHYYGNNIGQAKAYFHVKSQKVSIFSLHVSEMKNAKSICNIMILLVLLAERANTLNKVLACGKSVFHGDM